MTLPSFSSHLHKHVFVCGVRPAWGNSLQPEGHLFLWDHVGMKGRPLPPAALDMAGTAVSMEASWQLGGK